MKSQPNIPVQTKACLWLYFAWWQCRQWSESLFAASLRRWFLKASPPKPNRWCRLWYYACLALLLSGEFVSHVDECQWLEGSLATQRWTTHVTPKKSTVVSQRLIEVANIRWVDLHADICLIKSQHAGIPQPASHSQKIVPRFKHGSVQTATLEGPCAVFLRGRQENKVFKIFRSYLFYHISISSIFHSFVLSNSLTTGTERDMHPTAKSQNCWLESAEQLNTGVGTTPRTASHLHPLHTLTGDGGVCM